MKYDVLIPKPWLVRPRKYVPRLITIHATRGKSAPNLQYSATRNWLQSVSNEQENFSWGSSCNFIVGNDPGEITLVSSFEVYSSWGCGFGETGTWSVDEHGFSIEIPQSVGLEAFDVDAINNALDVCEYLCRTYNITPVRIPFLSQTGEIPSGLVGHEDTANGKKLGKTDPGDKFPWDSFITTLAKRLSPTPSSERVQQARLDFGTAAGELWIKDPSKGQKWNSRGLDDWRKKYGDLFI